MPQKYSHIREEELKNKIAADFFDKYDCTEIIKDIDFTVKAKQTQAYTTSENSSTAETTKAK